MSLVLAAQPEERQPIWTVLQSHVRLPRPDWQAYSSPMMCSEPMMDSEPKKNLELKVALLQALMFLSVAESKAMQASRGRTLDWMGPDWRQWGC